MFFYAINVRSLTTVLLIYAIPDYLFTVLYQKIKKYVIVTTTIVITTAFLTELLNSD